MRSYLTEHYVIACQMSMYQQLKNFSELSNEEKNHRLTTLGEVNQNHNPHPILSRLFAIPVAVIDVGLDTCKTPVKVVDHFAFAIINFVGATLSKLIPHVDLKRCSIEDSLHHAEGTLRQISDIPAALLMAVPKLVYQVAKSIYKPANAQPINFFKGFIHSAYQKPINLPPDQSYLA